MMFPTTCWFISFYESYCNIEKQKQTDGEGLIIIIVVSVFELFMELFFLGMLIKDNLYLNLMILGGVPIYYASILSAAL